MVYSKNKGLNNKYRNSGNISVIEKDCNYMSLEALSNITSNIIELANIEATINGTFSGFAFTVIILLLDRQAKGSDVNYDAEIGLASISVFFVTLIDSILASFLYANIGARNSECIPDERLYSLLLFPSVLFAISTCLLVLGLSLVLQAYHIKQILKLSQNIIWATIIFISVSFLYTEIRVLSITNKVGYDMLISLYFIMPVISIGFGLWGRHVSLANKSIDFFLKVCLWLSIFIGIFFTLSMDLLSKEIVISQFTHIFLNLSMSLIIGWTILYIPNGS